MQLQTSRRNVMIKSKKIATLFVLAAIAICCMFFGFYEVAAQNKPVSEVFTSMNNAQLEQTQSGLQITGAPAWGEGVSVNSYIDVNNFEFVFAEGMTGCVDIRFYDSVQDELRFFIRLNADPGTGDRNNVGLFRGDNGHYGWIPVAQMFVDEKSTLTCEDGYLYINGVDLRVYTGNKQLSEFMEQHPTFPMAALTSDLGRVHLAFENSGAYTLVGVNGTSLASDAADTSVPFFRMTAPASSATAGALVGVQYTVYDLIDASPQVSAQYRVLEASEWTDVAMSDNTFRAPMQEGTYIVRLKATDESGNVGYSEEFTLNVTSVQVPVISADIADEVDVGDSVILPEANVSGESGYEIETSVKVYDVYGDEVALAENSFTAEKYSNKYTVVYTSRYVLLPDVAAAQTYEISVAGADETLTLPNLFTPISANLAGVGGSEVLAVRDGILFEVTETWSGPRYDREIDFSDFSVCMKPVSNVTGVYLFLMPDVVGNFAGSVYMVKFDFPAAKFAVRQVADGAVVQEAEGNLTADDKGEYNFSISAYTTFTVNETSVTADIGLDDDSYKYFGFKFDVSQDQTTEYLIKGIDGQSFARPYESTPVIGQVLGVSESAVQGATMNVSFTATDYFGKALTAAAVLTGPDQVAQDLTVSNNAFSCTFTAAGTYSLTLCVTNEFGNTAQKTFTVQVTEPVEIGIEVVALPSKTVYKTGETFNAAGLAVYVLYEGGASAELASSDYRISGFDSSAAGEKTITVTYGTFTDTFTVTVEDPVLISVEINVNPTKLIYILGEDLDLTGMVVKAKYDTNKTETVTSYEVSGYDKTVLGEQTVTITYMGKTAFIKVNVTNDVTGIEITSAPAKTEYDKGEELDLSDLKVNKVFQNGNQSELSVEEYTVTGYDKDFVGEQTITVSFGEYTAQFTVTVNEKNGGCGATVSAAGISAAGLCLIVACVCIVAGKKKNTKEISE